MCVYFGVSFFFTFSVKLWSVLVSTPVQFIACKGSSPSDLLVFNGTLYSARLLLCSTDNEM